MSANMTKNRSRNRAIRDRMRRTGENFTTATRRMEDDHDRKAGRLRDGGSRVRDPSGSTRVEFSDEDSED